MMQTFTIDKGVDIPLAGKPEQKITTGGEVRHVALVGDDYVGLKPSMLVKVGDEVKLGQAVFTDKKNPGFNFTAPGCGKVTAIHRGAKRKFEALVIELSGDEEETFPAAIADDVSQLDPETMKELLQRSGLWTAFRKRPFGGIPGVVAQPSSVFVTAIDTEPLAADPLVIINEDREDFLHGLKVLARCMAVPIHLCVADKEAVFDEAAEISGVSLWQFSGPHPAGLPSTHIHFIDPVHAEKEVWHIGYQDVIKLGFFFRHGRLSSRTVVALSGEGFQPNTLVATRAGAMLDEVCGPFFSARDAFRVVSGSVLEGRAWTAETGFLGRYHRQISTVQEKSGRSLFGWCVPGGDRFSVTGLFTSKWKKNPVFSAITALWGGRRAIYPLDVYQNVMPLDIAALPLLKALAIRDAEKAIELGCLELVEEDLALCSYVCPGKNSFGPMLRELLTAIEKES